MAAEVSEASTAVPATSVPALDLSAFLAADSERRGDPGAILPPEAREVAVRWREAFASVGFAQITGHGVPDEAIEEAYGVAKRFFRLSAAEKAKSNLGRGYGPGGYCPQGVERVSATASRPDGSALLGADQARPPDRVENMIVHRRPEDVIPADVPGYEEAVYRYHDELTRLLRVLMRLTAASLDLPRDHFEAHFSGEDSSGPMGSTGERSLRLAYYPGLMPGEAPPAGQLRYGEHTDYTGFTILWQDHNKSGPQTAREGLDPPAGGLQVRMPDGAWADCPPEPRAFTVNAGDLIQVWTNDVFLSNTHRVVNPPPGDTGDRMSMVFFTGPSSDTVIECLPTCQGPDRPPRYEPITAGEHLQRKLSASNL